MRHTQSTGARLPLFALLAVVAISLPGCDNSVNFPTEPARPGPGGSIPPSGSIDPGPMVQQPRPIDPFTKLIFSAVGTVWIAQGGTPALAIEAPENILPFLRSETFGDSLEISIGETFNTSRPIHINYYLTVVSLEEIVLSGVGSIVVDALSGHNLAVRATGVGSLDLRVDLDHLEVDASGVGRFEIAGRTDSQTVRLSGTATYDARDLTSRFAQVANHGTGDATVRVSERLSVVITNIGSVWYIGDPAIDSTVTGLGHLDRLSD